MLAGAIGARDEQRRMGVPQTRLQIRESRAVRRPRRAASVVSELDDRTSARGHEEDANGSRPDRWTASISRLETIPPRATAPGRQAGRQPQLAAPVRVQEIDILSAVPTVPDEHKPRAVRRPRRARARRQSGGAAAIRVDHEDALVAAVRAGRQPPTNMIFPVLFAADAGPRAKSAPRARAASRTPVESRFTGSP